MMVTLIATLLALAWLTYRATVLLSIPIPTLVKILGLDLPEPPRVSLHGIASDSVTLHWSAPEKAASVAKHIIQINGANVGESERKETSVTVTGLNPDQIYNIRVIAANSQNFQAPGQLIRLRTLRESDQSSDGGGGTGGSNAAANGSTGNTMNVNSNPAIRDGTVEETPTIHATESLALQQNIGQTRRPIRRQHSPANQEIHDSSSSTTNASSGVGQSANVPLEHTVESLTGELEKLRKESEEVEVQILQVEEEHKATEAALAAEMEGVKEKKKEEDTVRTQLKTETRTLEDAKKKAEAQRAKVERLLRNKEDEIQKREDDYVRWEEERNAATKQVERLEEEAQARQKEAEEAERGKRAEIEPIALEVTSIEEEIRMYSAQIKKASENGVRERSKSLSGDRPVSHAKGEWPNGAQNTAAMVRQSSLANDDLDSQMDNDWSLRQKGLEERYTIVYNSFRLAQDDYQRSVEVLRSWQTRRSSLNGTGDTQSIKSKNKHRRNRNRKSRPTTISSPTAVYPVQDNQFMSMAGPFSSPMSTIGGQSTMSPSYHGLVSSAPLFNIANGAGPLSSSDFDRFTGGAPTSPTAESLLPSSLFNNNDDIPATPFDEQYGNDLFGPMATSPASSTSMSTSHLSSPRTSFPQFPYYQDEPEKMDRSNSISSINNSLRGINMNGTNDEMISGTKRFANIFSFNRPRGKTTLSHDLPPLGSLKGNQSQSYPRNDGPELDPIGTRRRSGSQGSTWMRNTNLHFPGLGNSAMKHTSTLSLTKPGLHDENDPMDASNFYDEPTSPRPASIASFDKALPKPSSDFRPFGWPSGRGMHASPLAANWTEIPNVNNASSLVSLPPSPHTSPPHIPTSRLAKVFSSSSRPVTPKLNPAAPDFEARFASPSTQPPPQSNHAPSHSVSSSIDKGKTADAHSIHTDASHTDSISSSIDQLSSTASTTGDRESNSGGKESLFSRFGLTRKASSTKLMNNTPTSNGHSNSSHYGSLKHSSSSASKFNLSSPFKKEGGLFGRSSKSNSKDTASSSSATGGSETASPLMDQMQDDSTFVTTPGGAGGHMSSDIFGSWKRETSSSRENVGGGNIETNSPWRRESGFFGVIGGGKKKQQQQQQKGVTDVGVTSIENKIGLDEYVVSERI